MQYDVSTISSVFNTEELNILQDKQVATRLRRLLACIPNEPEVRGQLQSISKSQWVTILEELSKNNKVLSAARDAGRTGIFNLTEDQITSLTPIIHTAFTNTVGQQIVGIVVGAILFVLCLVIAVISFFAAPFTLGSSIVFGASLITAILAFGYIVYMALDFFAPPLSIGEDCYGGNGGTDYSLPTTDVKRITSLTIYREQFWGNFTVSGLSISYIKNSNGAKETFYTSDYVKNNFPGEYKTIDLEEGEKIVSISGAYGIYIDWLAVTTRKLDGAYKFHGKYGGTAGSEAFILQLDDEAPILGFFGRAELRLDSFGIWHSNQSNNSWKNGTPKGGVPFSDIEAFESSYHLAEVSIAVGSVIDSIECTWKKSNGVAIGIKHGGDGGKLAQLILDDDEYISALRIRAGGFGFPSDRSGNFYLNVVKEIIFTTNKRSNITFSGVNHEINSPQADYWVDILLPAGSKGIGFYGYSGAYVDDLGLLFRSA